MPTDKTTWWSDYRKRRRSAARKKGRCPYHPKREAEPGKTLCSQCLDAKRNYERSQRTFGDPMVDSGRCQICARHGNGAIMQDEDRGRICSNCYAGLGFFQESVKALRRAAAYVIFFSKRNNAARGVKVDKQSTVHTASSSADEDLNYKSDSRRETAEL